MMLKRWNIESGNSRSLLFLEGEMLFYLKRGGAGYYPITRVNEHLADKSRMQKSIHKSNLSDLKPYSMYKRLKDDNEELFALVWVEN